MTVLGNNLKKFRKQMNISIRRLSDLSGVSKSVISEIENGKSLNPRYDTIVKLSSALNVQPESLTEMEVNHEYVITDVEEAIKLILDQPGLMLNGELLTDDDKIILANSIQLGLRYAAEMREKKNK